MKKQITLWLLFIPMLLIAQEDQRYQPGAVPVEEGKVVFTKKLSVASLAGEQLYDRLLAWAENRYQDERNRVAYQNREKSEFAVAGMEKLIFTSNALSLDTSEMSYHLIVTCDGSTAEIRMENITYKYDVSYERTPQRLIAEEVITDKYALTKKNKLNRINGKFRKATVDFADLIFGEIDHLFMVQAPPPPPVYTAYQTTQTGQVTAPVQNVPATPQVTTTPQAATNQPVKEGYIAFEASKVPQAILMLLPTSPMRVTAGDTSSPVETNATWKGISEMFGKNVATITLPASSPVYQQIKGLYTLSFLKDGSDEPWMIIECNKQGETTEGANKTLLGEIIHVWIK